MSLPQLNPVEPPWYGPVCPVVGEGWHREVSSYPDPCPFPVVAQGHLKADAPDLVGRLGTGQQRQEGERKYRNQPEVVSDAHGRFSRHF
jgi:hypothetical protein